MFYCFMVNMTNQPNNYVKDIENRDKLDTGLQNLWGIESFDFKKFDKDVEDSFQKDFLDNNKNNFLNLTDQQKQDLFNGWLNSQFDKINAFKNNEIAKKIIVPTTFELQNLNTLSELEIFQQQMIEQKKSTETQVSLDLIGVWDLKLKLYRWLDAKKWEIVQELNKNFDNREEVIKLIKAWDVESIRKLQCMLVGLEYKSGQIQTNESMKNPWTDWLFWTETFDALKKYISDNKIDGNVVKTTVDDKKVITETRADGTVVTTTIDSNGVVTSNTTYEYGNTPSVGVETYGGKSVYECELNKTVNLIDNVFPKWSTITIIPKYEDTIVTFSSDGKLQYSSKFAGQDNFTVIVKDATWNVLYQNNVIINVKSNVDQKTNINNYQSAERQIDQIMSEINKVSQADFKKQRELIENKLFDMRKEYQKNQKKYEDNSVSSEDKEKLTDRNNEIEKITKALIIKEAEVHMKEYLNRDHDSLEKKLNDKTCDYYFGGEYISKEKFIKRLEKGKIDLSKTRFVNLDVSLDNYAKTNGDTDIYKYLMDEKWDKRNFTIKDLILTDDPYLGIGRGLTKDQEIQYKAEKYTWKESWREFSDNEKRAERQALKRILWIKGLFGLGWVDEDMSIATEDYNTNNPSLWERRNLRKLKNILLDINKDPNMTVQEKFRGVAKDYHLSIPPRPSQWADKDQQALFELYKMYKEEQNCGDYFKKVMWLFENYFVRWVDNFDVVSDDKDASGLFVNMYKQEAIWRTDWLIDPDKRKQAIKTIFNESNKKWNIDLGVGFADSKELKDLNKIVKKIDLSTYLTDPNASKKHKEFAKLYDKYKDSRNKDIKDSEGRFVVRWEAESDDKSDLYYNAVFDFLIWAVEWRKDVVSAVNATKVMDMITDTNVEEKEKDWYDNEHEKAFVMFLADFNQDGRVDHGDRWYVMWLTVKNMYKSVKVDQNYLEKVPEGENAFTPEAPWKNLMNFCKVLMEQNGDVALLSDVEKLQNEPLEKILEAFKTNPGLLGYFQNTLANSPMPVDYIFRYGANASKAYMEFVLPQIESGNFKIEWLENKFQAEYKRLVEQWLVDSPEIRDILKPMFYAGVLREWWVSYGSVWTGLTLDAGKAGQFSMNLWYGDMPGVGENGETEAVLGVVFSYGKSVNVSKNTSLNFGAGVWATNKSLFLPIVYGNVWIKSRLNPNVDLKSLKAKSAHYFSAWANLTWIPWVWLGWWAMLWWSRDKMQLIDDQSIKIKETLTSRSGVLYKSLEWVDWSKDKENVVSGIKQNMAKHFYNKELNDLNNDQLSLVSKAAENLYRWISYYSAWLKLKADDPRLTQIIHEVSEAYAVQWKNDAKFDAKDLHISGAGISVQMLAGYIPIVWVVEFTKYKNLYSKETNQSHANYYERLVTGKWMDFVERKDFYSENWYINEKWVAYLNAKLSIAHPEVSVPDLDIRLMPSTDSADSEPKQALYIPKNLIQYANINIDANVADYTTTETIGEVEYIVVPANTKIWLMDYSRLNSARFHLFIWDNKAKSNDIKVWYDMVDFGWDPRKYEWYLESINVNKEEINVEVTKINGWLEATEYKDKHPLPIKECAKVENWKAVFELKAWFGGKCVDVGWNNSLINIEWDSLTMPQTGTLSIIKRSDGKYHMYYRSVPVDKLSIDYQLEWSVTVNNTVSNTVTTTIESGQTINWNERKTSFVDIFSEYDAIDRIFDGIEKDLSKMDDNNPWKYATFMNAASDIVNRSMIDNSNYETAFNALKEILKNKIDGNIFDSLRAKIQDQNLSLNDKVMMVDRFKAIFSYHIDLTNWSNDWKYLKSLISWRWDIYKNLKWYDRSQVFPVLQNNYRTNILNQIWNNDKLDKIEKNNLFGMTAFYRLWNSHEWRSYSMTQMWSTNVLGGYMEKIAESDLKSTQNWFLNNLNKSGPHKDILKDTLQKQIWISELELSDEQLKQLLSWNHIDINDWKTRIKLDLDYVFYLLWECANESIGIDLKSITVMEKITTDDNNQEIVPDPREGREEIREGGRWKVTVKWDKTYSSGIYSGTVWSNAQNEYAKKDQAKVAGWYIIGPKSGDETDNQYTEDGNEDDNQYTETDNQFINP